MCGILFSNRREVSLKDFKVALKLMNHRGPDAMGAMETNGTFLGHTRLKILDLKDRSNQPFESACGNYLIIFNGEIYNYRELAIQHDIRLRTTSDTELLLELYIKLGAKALSLIEGMFAFIIYHKATGEVFIARDRLGVKPLYIRHEAGCFSVSSEMASLLALTGTPDYDKTGLRQYLKMRTFFGGHTLYQGIEMFPAAHYWANGRYHRYWNLPEGDQDPPGDDELKELIDHSVENRMVSDVPVGSYLSGGIDSTIVATLARKPHTWTVGFRDENEFEWAQLAARRIESIHHEVLLSYEEFQEIAQHMIQKRKEPLSVPNEVLLFRMTQEVKALNTVVMSGEGADELFFGYDRIFRWAQDAEQWDIEKFASLYAYGSHDDIEVVDSVLMPYRDYGRPIDIVARFFQIEHLHGLLRRLDNATMMCSVEARVPFVDCHRLVERMSGVPFSYRMADGVVKSPLKRLYEDVLPSAIIGRKKVGFPVPLSRMSFDSHANTPMDRWLHFNLRCLMGVDEHD